MLASHRRLTGAAVSKTITHRTVAILPFCWRACLCLGFILQTHILHALDADRRISQYAHTAWRTQDGAFSGTPNAIMQTADGYIWIGTQAGLVRFDGVRFVCKNASEWISLLAGRISSGGRRRELVDWNRDWADPLEEWGMDHFSRRARTRELHRSRRKANNLGGADADAPWSESSLPGE